MSASVKVNGALIRQIRESRGMERPELASLAGVEPYQMYVIERKRQSTRPKTLRLIAEALDVTTEELVSQKSGTAS